MSILEDSAMRELEVEIAHAAIRSVLITWGTGWFYMSVEQREAELALAIMQYCSGDCTPRGLDKWGELKKLGITAYDCMSILRICKDWSVTDRYDHHLVKYANDDPGWDMDPIPYLKRYVRQVFGG